MANACDLYVSPPFSRTWRAQAFPSGNPAVIRMSAGELIAARRAWNFFEQVEAADAATRVRLSDNGGWTPSSLQIITPSTWFPLTGPGDITLYRKGQQLHRRVCPNYDWTPQRYLPIPSTPLLDIGPALCPDCSGGEYGANAIATVEPTSACTPQAAALLSGGTRSIVNPPQQARATNKRGVNPTPVSSTPQTSTTPKTATPKSSTTPMSTTPKPSSTPQPPSSPVLLPKAAAPSPPEMITLKEPAGPQPMAVVPPEPSPPEPKPTEVGSTVPVGASRPVGTSSHIGTPRAVSSPLASGLSTKIGTPRPIGSPKPISSASVSQIATRPASPPPERTIDLIITEKTTSVTA